MVIYEGITDNEVALTFDDGPNPEVTPKILKILKEKGVKATFFLIGRRAEQYPETVKLIVSEGHDIGNHSYSHADGGLYKVQDERGANGVINEIKGASDVIKKISGITDNKLLFYRPQGLKWTTEWGELAQQFFGDNIIMSKVGSNDYNWNHDTHSWDQRDSEAINVQAERIIADVKANARPGSIICLHDSAEYELPGTSSHESWMNRALPTLQALPTLIDNLRHDGMVIRRLSELKLKTESLRDD